MRKLKYLAAYSIPLSTYIALEGSGVWSYATLIFAFGILPFIELFAKGNNRNLSEAEVATESELKIYDVLLILNIPIQFYLVYLFGTIVSTESLTNSELSGKIISLGISIGTIGINVAHELGHRSERLHQTLSVIQLIPGHYSHFFIEHNLGHHKHVSTPEDPATARYGENIYFFWIRSVVMSYISAWKIETYTLKKGWTLRNRMIWFTLLQAAYLTGIVLLWGWTICLWIILAGIIGFLLLESVNYIEHYGLVRKKLPNGRYEPIQIHHSWNSNHSMGRIILYELTRHSDHHFKSTAKYQVLKHYNESPQLPLGYPASILLALCPPLWFWQINPLVPQ